MDLVATLRRLVRRSRGEDQSSGEQPSRSPTEAAALITAYARHHDPRLLDGNHGVVSPAGSWILLALAAHGATGEAADRLERTLGAAPEEASEIARALVEHVHPALVAGAGCWWAPQLTTPDLPGWVDTAMPESATRGALPGQGELDDWALRVTGGQISRFPVRTTSDSALVLAAALASEGAWQDDPYEIVDGKRLGGDWAQVGGVLTDSGGGIARTGDGTLVAHHTRTTEQGLAVTSVISPPAVSPAQAVTTALEVAAGDAEEVSLWDLELGEGHAWTLTEQTVEGVDVDPLVVRTLLPAWETKAEPRELQGHDVGFEEAAAALARFVAEPQGVTVRQAATATYTATGFRAAAVTAMDLVATGPPAETREVRQRVLEIRFARPYAAVAVTTTRVTATTGGIAPGISRWAGVPVWTAWITEPVDAHHLDHRTHP